MEYLVVMTTRVPNGVSGREVADVRSREAAHTQVLARDGRVLRLWRPPLLPGEWRTIGLFVAQDPADLERTLASMPLRIWRTDDVTALRAHPNDPGPGRTATDPTATEFLTTFAVTVPDGAAPAQVDTMLAREADRIHELAEAGHLVRLWRLPGEGRNLGLWQAMDSGGMHGILQSLPMAGWLNTDVVPLTPHPSDPVRVDADRARATGLPPRPRPRRRTAS